MLSYGTKHSKVAEGYLHNPSCSKMSWFSLCLWEHILFLEDVYVHSTGNGPWCLDLLIFLMPSRGILMLIVLMVQKARKMGRDVCTISAGSCRLSHQSCGCVLPCLHPDKAKCKHKFLGLSTGLFARAWSGMEGVTQRSWWLTPERLGVFLEFQR